MNPGPRISIDDQLAALKRNTGGAARLATACAVGTGAETDAQPPPQPKRTAVNVDDDLAALKKKMAAAPPKRNKEISPTEFLRGLRSFGRRSDGRAANDAKPRSASGKLADTNVVASEFRTL